VKTATVVSSDLTLVRYGASAAPASAVSPEVKLSCAPSLRALVLQLSLVLDEPSPDRPPCGISQQCKT
jgi:hypothetical protein